MVCAPIWKAICISWQQGSVQQIVECLQHADDNGVSEVAQDAFINALTL